MTEDDYILVETCSPHITLCNNKNSQADVQFLLLQYDINHFKTYLLYTHTHESLKMAQVHNTNHVSTHTQLPRPLPAVQT